MTPSRPCQGCRYATRKGCTEGRSEYPHGSPESCKPTQTKKGWELPVGKPKPE
jgi:hypothetical protein